MTIGIIGNGVVGSTLAKWFKDAKVYDIDPTRSPHSLEEVSGCDMIFIAINLKENASTTAEYAMLVEYAERTGPGATVVIKTTVVPGTCSRLENRFRPFTTLPYKKILYNPEFLTEAHPWRDFLDPSLQVIGHNGNLDAAEKLHYLLPKAFKFATVTFEQAEWLKLAVAGFLSTKVSFFNQLYDAFGKENFDIVSDLMTHDPRIGQYGRDILQNGYRGWGGKCFTKDVPLFAALSKMPLVQEAVRYNSILITGGKT